MDLTFTFPFIFAANASKCNEGQFQCTSTHKCIPNNWVCDGEYDCGTHDISDEINCKYIPVLCVVFLQLCPALTGQVLAIFACLLQLHTHNTTFFTIRFYVGRNDEVSCRPYQSKCSNGFCLDISRFCDGIWDCDNDEVKCGK